MSEGLGAFVKETREAAGLLQRELAAACGVTRQAIGHMEQDGTVPRRPIITFPLIAAAVGVPEQEFWNRIPSPVTGVGTHIGRLMKEYRENAGYTRGDLAIDLLDCSLDWLRKVEVGQIVPTGTRAMTLWLPLHAQICLADLDDYWDALEQDLDDRMTMRHIVSPRFKKQGRRVFHRPLTPRQLQEFADDWWEMARTTHEDFRHAALAKVKDGKWESVDRVLSLIGTARDNGLIPKGRAARRLYPYCKAGLHLTTDENTYFYVVKSGRQKGQIQQNCVPCKLAHNRRWYHNSEAGAALRARRASKGLMTVEEGRVAVAAAVRELGPGMTYLQYDAWLKTQTPLNKQTWGRRGSDGTEVRYPSSKVIASLREGGWALTMDEVLAAAGLEKIKPRVGFVAVKGPLYYETATRYIEAGVAPVKAFALAAKELGVSASAVHGGYYHERAKQPPRVPIMQQHYEAVCELMATGLGVKAACTEVAERTGRSRTGIQAAYYKHRG